MSADVLSSLRVDAAPPPLMHLFPERVLPATADFFRSPLRWFARSAFSRQQLTVQIEKKRIPSFSRLTE